MLQLAGLMHTNLTNVVTLPCDLNSIASYNQVPMTYVHDSLRVHIAHNVLLYYMGMSIDVKAYAPKKAATTFQWNQLFWHFPVTGSYF